MRGRKILITCEHAGNYVPKDYKFMFAGAEEVLESHRGWDPGAIGIAKYLARQLEAPLFFQKVSRLLIEMNRSIGNKELYSEFTQNIDKTVKGYLLEKFYNPYREEVEKKIADSVRAGEAVLHISVHTFTPVLNGIVRAVDLGILFDDACEEEKQFCESWKAHLDDILPEHVTMLNCPYNGADDGFTTYLRTRFSGKEYLGIEIEINQKYIDTPDLSKIKEALAQSLLSLSVPT